MIKAPDFLPLGSIISLEGNPKKMMVVGRALVIQNEGREEYCDYGLCLYPEGMLGDVSIYSNHENIETVHARGFADAEDVAVRNVITAALAELEVPKSRPEPLEAW